MLTPNDLYKLLEHRAYTLERERERAILLEKERKEQEEIARATRESDPEYKKQMWAQQREEARIERVIRDIQRKNDGWPGY